MRKMKIWIFRKQNIFLSAKIFFIHCHCNAYCMLMYVQKNILHINKEVGKRMCLCVEHSHAPPMYSLWIAIHVTFVISNLVFCLYTTALYIWRSLMYTKVTTWNSMIYFTEKKSHGIWELKILWRIELTSGDFLL